MTIGDTAEAGEGGLPPGRRRLAMIAVGLSLTLAVLDSAIANVALPTIGRDLGSAPAEAVWVVNAYQLAIVTTLLPLAALGEIVGFRRVYLAGLTVFTAASAACAFARSMEALALARAAQGLGAAGVMSVNGALVLHINPRSQLGRAVGVTAMVVSVASALGPTVASAILSVARWPWLFAVNAPIGVFALIASARAIPVTPRAARAFDGLGAALNAGAFGLIVLGAEAAERGAAAQGGLELAVGFACALVLGVREWRKPVPLIPFDLLRIRMFGLSVLTSIFGFMAQALALVSLPFRLEGPFGRTAVATGLLVTPWPLAVALVSPFAGRLAERRSPGALAAAGMALLAAGLGSLALLAPGASTGALVGRMFICGIGFGLFQSPNNRAMLGSAPRVRSGAAGGMQATARLIGQTAGAAGVAALFRLAGGAGSRAPLVAAAIAAGVSAAVSGVRLAATGAEDRGA